MAKPVKNRKKTGSRFKRGESGNPNGRPLGARNKTSREFKAAVAAVFNAGGGETWLLRWAKRHPTEFFQIAARLAPKEVVGDFDVHTTDAPRVIVYLPDNGRGPQAAAEPRPFDRSPKAATDGKS